MKSRTQETPYGALYRKYPFLNMLSRKQIAALGYNSYRQGDIEFATACKTVITTDTTRFRGP